ncbi:MAG: phosphatase PAP2 family protein [Candidatus Levybacteria bacterium]|nr:phosphatase PAP2 family protein [Candidatus Levybacteria bacterium]MDZ4227723.1 phosphatase PAP2 family protein [Candidatus Levybacteria bacterium]
MLDILMIFLAKYLYLFIVVIAVLFLIKEKTRRKSILIFSAFVLPLTLIASQIAGKIYYNPRPFVVEHFAPLITHAANNGFPSDHSLVSFALASIVFLFNKKLGFVLFFLAFLVGLSRVYVGVHHPIDILGSFLICIIVVLICAKIISWRK